MTGESTTERQKSCEERLPTQLAGRVADFAEIIKRSGEADSSDEREQADDELYAIPLAVELLRTVRIDLSTGGPADWIEVQLDADNEARRIEYHFSDWFDHAAVSVEGDDFDTLDAFARRITADYYFES